MMVAVESWLRRMAVWGKVWWKLPWVASGLRGLYWCLRGFGASALSLRQAPQPFALGVILMGRPWQGALAAVGALAGYRLFWGEAGDVGIWWSLAGAFLALVDMKGKKLRLLWGTLLVAGVGLWFRFALGVRTSPALELLRIAAAGVFLWLMGTSRRPVRWLRTGLWAMALGQTMPGGIPGCLFAGAVAVAGSFPTAVLAGAGLDLARVTAVPMASALALGWLARFFPGKGIRFLLPAAGFLGASVLAGRWDPMPLLGLSLGGIAGLYLPRELSRQSQGGAGLAQVRLELAAEVMGTLVGSFLAAPVIPIDREALLQQARNRSCGSCSLRRDCLEQQRLTATMLEDSRDLPCRRPGRMGRELQRSRDQLRLLKMNQRRREEYRQALTGQYRVLGEYMHSLADRLPREGPARGSRFGVTVSVRTRGCQAANGDRWAAFPGEQGSYFVLLCDGMGTGPGAQEEGRQAIRLLKTMLTAAFSPEGALRTLNDQLALTGRAGAVTVDLAQIRLDTGRARVYKWGAAPSWLVDQEGVRQLGRGGAPPGLLAGADRQPPETVSLTRQEQLLLLSDGVDTRDLPHRLRLTAGAPPGVLADRLLEGSPSQDDATAAVIRLYRKSG